MVDDRAVYGSKDAPVDLGPFDTIIKFQSGNKGRFAVLTTTVWYRYKIEAINEADIAVTQSYVSYRASNAWPPANDDIPVWEGAAGMTSGAPVLPGIGDFTAGYIVNTNVTGPGLAIRFSTPPSSTPPPSSAPSAPAGGQWGSAVATLEALIVAAVDSLVVGIAGSVNINFTGLRLRDSRFTYRAIASCGHPVNTVANPPDNPFTRYGATISVLLQKDTG